MKWVLIVLFCFSSVSAAVAGSKRCTWGPSHWCRDLQTAKDCNTVPHCLRIWKAKSTAVSNTETCIICKIIIQGLKTIVANNKTQEEIKEIAEETCNLIKNEKTAYEVCNTIVYLYLPEVLKMINSEIDADTICKLLHFCDATKLEYKYNHPSELISKSKADNSCKECQLAIKMAKNYVSDKTFQNEVLQFVDKEICQKLTEFKSLCIALVANDLPRLFKVAEHILVPEGICFVVGLCPKILHKTSKRYYVSNFKQFAVTGMECELCQTGVNEVRDMLRNASNQQKIETVLKTVCSHLGPLENMCKQGVSQYLPVVVKFAINELDPVIDCRAFGLCPASGLPVSNLPAKIETPRALPLCVLCEFVISKLDSIIGVNRSEAAITSALEEVCDIMPRTIRAECNDFVSKYAPEVVKLLVEKIAPTLVCTSLGLCVGETKTPDYVLHKFRPQSRVGLL